MGSTKMPAPKLTIFNRELKENEFGITMGIYIALNTKIIQLGPNWDGQIWENHPIVALLKIISLLALLYVLTLKINDNGYKKWQAFLWLIPFLGPIYVLYLAFTDNH